MKHIFHIYHPAVVFLYIAAALAGAMTTRNPVAIGVSFAAGSAYAVYLNGARKYARTLRMVLVTAVFVAVLNPLFNHSGTTVLFYALGNPITAEACWFGLSSAGMLACVFVWFSVYAQIMTNDKFLYLFGRALPTAALMMAMVSRLLPMAARRLRQVRGAQAAMGTAGGTWRQRAAAGVRLGSIWMGAMMEQSFETAASMNARGFGGRRRTSYVQYRWAAHDIGALAVLAALVGAAGYMAAVPFAAFVYFPAAGGPLFSAAAVAGYALYALLLLFPLLLELLEKTRWR